MSVNIEDVIREMRANRKRGDSGYDLIKSISSATKDQVRFSVVDSIMDEFDCRTIVIELTDRSTQKKLGYIAAHWRHSVARLRGDTRLVLYETVPEIERSTEFKWSRHLRGWL